MQNPIHFFFYSLFDYITPKNLTIWIFLTGIVFILSCNYYYYFILLFSVQSPWRQTETCYNLVNFIFLFFPRKSTRVFFFFYNLLTNRKC